LKNDRLNFRQKMPQEFYEDLGTGRTRYRSEFEDDVNQWELPSSNIFHGLQFTARGVVRFTKFQTFIEEKVGWGKSDVRSLFTYLKYQMRSKKLRKKVAKNDLPYEAVLDYEREGETLTTKFEELLDIAKKYIKERKLSRKKYIPLFAFMGIDFREKAYMDSDQFYNHISRLNILGMTRGKCDQMFDIIDKEQEGKILYKELSYYSMVDSWSVERGLNNLVKDGVLDDTTSVSRSMLRSSTKSIARKSTISIKPLGIEEQTRSKEAYQEWLQLDNHDNYVPTRRSSLGDDRKQERTPSVRKSQSRGYDHEDDVDSKELESKLVTPHDNVQRYWKELDTNRSGHVGQKEFVEWVRSKVPNIFREPDYNYLFALMDKNGSGQISKREFWSVMDTNLGLSEHLQQLLLKGKPMVASSPSHSAKEGLFEDLPFDIAGNVKLKEFRKWFLDKLQQENFEREVLEYEISRLFIHLGARSQDDFLSAVDLKDFKRRGSWSESIDDLLKEAARIASSHHSKRSSRSRRDHKESPREDTKYVTSHDDYKRRKSKEKNSIPKSTITNSVYAYTRKHIFDEIAVAPGLEVTKKEFIHFVTDKWAWVNNAQAARGFKRFTGGRKKLTRKRYFEKLLEAGGRSELDAFLRVLDADLSNAEVPIGNFCNQQYQQRLKRQEKKIKNLSGWKETCKKEIIKWQLRSESAEKQVIDLKVQTKYLKEAFSDMEKKHLKDTMLIDKLKKEIGNLRVVTFRVFDGIEANERGYVTVRQFKRWFVEKVPWAYPQDAVTLFNYVGHGAEEIDMEKIQTYMYNTNHTSFHAKVKTLLACAGQSPDRPKLLFDTLEYNFAGRAKLSEFYNWMREKARWVSFVDTQLLFQYLDIECSGEISRRELDEYVINTTFDDALQKLVKDSGGTSDPTGRGADIFITTCRP